MQEGGAARLDRLASVTKIALATQVMNLATSMHTAKGEMATHLVVDTGSFVRSNAAMQVGAAVLLDSLANVMKIALAVQVVSLATSIHIVKGEAAIHSEVDIERLAIPARPVGSKCSTQRVL